MKSFAEFFSSLLNMSVFCKEESKDELSKTNHEKEEDEKEEKKKDKEDKEEKKDETFEFIEINENTLTQDDIEDMFITKF